MAAKKGDEEVPKTTIYSVNEGDDIIINVTAGCSLSMKTQNFLNRAGVEQRKPQQYTQVSPFSQGGPAKFVARERNVKFKHKEAYERFGHFVKGENGLDSVHECAYEGVLESLGNLDENGREIVSVYTAKQLARRFNRTYNFNTNLYEEGPVPGRDEEGSKCKWCKSGERPGWHTYHRWLNHDTYHHNETLHKLSRTIIEP